MSGSGDFDFIGQILQQAPLILILPFIFGTMYIASMVIIFRRAAERRRKARIARGEAPNLVVEKPKHSWSEALRAIGERLRRPEMPAFAAATPASAARLPEPDLDLLTMPVSVPAESVLEAQAAPTAPTVPVISESARTPQVMAAITLPPEPQENVVTQPTIDLDVIEVMRIYRDVSDGGLVIQMGSQRYRSLDEINNPDLTRRLIAVARELWTLAGGNPSLTVPAAPRSTASAPVVMPSDVTPSGGLRARLNSAAGDTGPLKRFVQQARGGAPKDEKQPGGIADAVEEFLQFKLLSNPQFAARSIHIRPAHDHGVRIEVDGHYYDSIGDVVDADVREFLAGMMKEWEARQ